MSVLRTRTAAGTETPREAPATASKGSEVGAGRPITRRAAAVTATAFAVALLRVARLIRLLGALVFALIALAILLRDVKANPSNGIVKGIHDAAHWFTSPFAGMFHVHGARAELSLNWGVAAIIYLAAAVIIAAIVTRQARASRQVI